MLKKKNMLLRVATWMLAIAPIAVEARFCFINFGFLGEPELPKKIDPQ